MNYNLLTEYILTFYGLFTGLGLLVGSLLYTLIRNNYIKLPSYNIDSPSDNIGAPSDNIGSPSNNLFTPSDNSEDPSDNSEEPSREEPSDNREVSSDTIVPSSNNIESIITDDSSDSETDSDSKDTIDSQTTVDVNVRDLDFVPNVDLNENSIYELKHFEISSLFSQQIAANHITDDELDDIIGLFSESELLTNDVNDLILAIIDVYHK